MRHLSLFAGIGGFDLAAERAGMVTVGQVEIDGPCRSVLERWWPEVPRWEDVHDVTAESLWRGTIRESAGRTSSDPIFAADHHGRREAGPRLPGGPGRPPPDTDRGGTDGPTVDVLTGGFPCQDYSVAGNRAGLAGDRGALWWQMHRIVAGIRPAWVVGENVPGLLSSRGGADFGTIIDSLTDIGYGVCWAVLDSRWFGVAQRRRRVFIVGHSGGVPRPEVLALGEGLFGHPAPGGETGQVVTQAFTGSTFGGGGVDDNRAQAGFVVPLNWQSGGTQTRIVGPDDGTIDTLHASQTPAIAFTAKDAGADATTELSPTLRAMNHTESHQNAGGQVGVVSSATVRRLTPVECARLQGFPDHWNDHLSDTQRYRQYGNAVTVNVAEWVMRRIAAGSPAWPAPSSRPTHRPAGSSPPHSPDIRP